MKNKLTVQEVVDALWSLSKTERRNKAQTYYPTSMEVMGVSNPAIRLVVKEIFITMKNASRHEILYFAEQLVQTNIVECQLAAWWLLGMSKPMIPSLSIRESELIRGTLDNWVSVDNYGVDIYGVLWRIGTISDQQVHALLDSPDVWQRRLALVGVVALNTRSAGGTGDTIRTLAVCEKVIHDRHDMIEKALSWALRSLVYWDKPAVESFLTEHHHTLPSRVKREVWHKLTHGTKN